MMLRPRQKHFVERSLIALQTYGNTLSVAATGFGKTVCLSAVTDQALREGDQQACVLVHRDELVDQNRRTFERFTQDRRLTTSVVNAQEKSWSGQVTFAMVPSLTRARHLAQMPPVDILVIDEAHHAAAPSYLRIINHARQMNPDIWIFGVTASPARGDGKGLRPVFSNVADQVSISEVIRDGHLVPPRTFVLDLGVQQQLQTVQRSADEFDMEAVAAILDHQVLNEAVVRHWRVHAGQRKTVVFCSTVQHARHVCAAFTDANVPTAVIDGCLSRTERQGILHRFDQGDLQVLVNCFVLTEGFDSQPVSCIVLLRPSSQKSTFIQMVGRGLRTVDPARYPGVTKTDCVVLDFGTSSLMHGSLEQDVCLDDASGHGQAPQKDCPQCGAQMPARTQECPLCGHLWERPTPKEHGDTLLDDFILSEVDLLKRSTFRWCDLFGDEAAWMATGFEAWAGVFGFHGHWFAMGGAKRLSARLLAQGDRTVCLAAADDWLNDHETEDAALKSHRWQSQGATPQQLRYLPTHHRQDFGLTRYQASCLLAFQFNKRDIQQRIFREFERQEVA